MEETRKTNIDYVYIRNNDDDQLNNIEQVFLNDKTSSFIFKRIILFDEDGSIHTTHYFPLQSKLYREYPTYKFSSEPILMDLFAPEKIEKFDIDQYLTKVIYYDEEQNEKKHYFYKLLFPSQFFMKAKSSSSSTKKRKLDQTDKVESSKEIFPPSSSSVEEVKE